tara:strand:+ start:2815 stop:3399 length:585 start_codon:yes stop_codon:yes gene_type:complete
MAWIKLGTDTHTSATQPLEVSFTANKFITGLTFVTPLTNNPFIRLGSTSIDSGSNYTYREAIDGGSDTTQTSNSNGMPIMNPAANNVPSFGVFYIINIASEEKLYICNTVHQNTAGAGTAPRRTENTAKWINTSNQADIVHVRQNGDTNQAVDDNLSILGSEGVEELNVQDGAIYYETDTNKEFLLYNDVWTEL